MTWLSPCSRGTDGDMVRLMARTVRHATFLDASELSHNSTGETGPRHEAGEEEGPPIVVGCLSQKISASECAHEC